MPSSSPPGGVSSYYDLAVRIDGKWDSCLNRARAFDMPSVRIYKYMGFVHAYAETG